MKEFLIRAALSYGFMIPFTIIMWYLNKNNIIDVNILVGHGILIYGVIAGCVITAITIDM